MKRKILLIHTGGTLGMVEGRPTNELKPAELHESVLNFIPELSELAELDTVFACNIDSANLNISHINAVCDVIEQSYRSYDGFVIIHGTDTMAFHASALSYLLQHNQKPVIFTGSQKPLRKIRTDARLNLVNSVEFATMDLPEVGICFHSKLLRGNRTRKRSSGDFDAFESPNYPLLATVGVDIAVNHAFVARPPRTNEKPVFDRLQHQPLAIWTLFPGFDPGLFLPGLLDSGVRALLIHAYASGNMPIIGDSLIPAIATLTEKGIPVYVTSQAMCGRVNLGLYECGRRAMEAGAVGCGTMTLEAAMAKLMFLLSRNTEISREALNIKMQLDLAGELS